MHHKVWIKGAVFFLLVVMTTEVGLSTRQQSPSWDEGDHIFSGYMNWKNREYSLNPEHPPLVKLIATLPLLPLSLKTAPREGRFFKAEAYYGGRELIFRNDPKYGGLYSADTLLFRVHMTAFLFGLTLAVLIFFATKEMFGPIAALFALTLYVFDPTVLANAPFVATDTGAACGFFAAVYTFYRFVKWMDWRRIALCGLAVGLALVTKHSAVLLLPILLLLAAGEFAGRWKTQRRWPARDALHMLRGMAAIAALALFVVWAVYSFRFAMHPMGVEMPPMSDQVATLSPLARGVITFCADHHLLPESYLYGLADVQKVGTVMPTYILGKVYEHGQWYYFPAILSLKWTVGTLGLLALAIYAFATGRVRRPREVFFLGLPVVFFLAVAMAGPLNIGVRHVLPVFPFIFALAAGGAAWLVQKRRVWIYPVAALLLWHVVDSVRTFPNYLPYANTLWGGSAKTNRYFSDSAADWGQQLKQTRQWVDAHNVKECSFAYFAAPFLLPSDYGIPCTLLPTFDSMGEQDLHVPAVVHGPLLVSYGDLNGFEFGSKLQNPYQQLFDRTPDDVIANGIAVFYGDFTLPRAAALEYVQRARVNLKKDPQSAFHAAQQAVALAPDGFDANLALGDAAVAVGDWAAAQSAYDVAMLRVAEMEPTAQQYWRPLLKQKIAVALNKGS
jgi:hypothetical protein